MKKPSLQRAGLVLLLLALVGGLAFALLRTGPLAAVQVVAAPVQAGRIEPVLFGIGTVEARRSWLMGPTVAGRVLSVQVDVGDAVQSGDLLAELDPVDLQQRLAALDAAVARAASLQSAAQAQMADTQARQTLARANAKRNQELADQQFISPSALAARAQEQASAEAAYAAAQANLAASQQEVARTQAERAALQRQRSNTQLRAPAAAVVTSREAEAGSTVLAGQAVVRLVDQQSLWVKVRIDQGRSAGLVVGQRASVTVRSQPQTPIAGSVARVEWTADPVTEERLAYVALDSGAGPLPGLSLGELAEVRLQLPAVDAALRIPHASVQRTNQQVGVWRMQDGQVAFAPVRLGAVGQDGFVQVLEGLQAGDSVVVYSQKALSARSRIRVVERLISSPQQASPKDANP